MGCTIFNFSGIEKLHQAIEHYQHHTYRILTMMKHVLTRQERDDEIYKILTENSRQRIYMIQLTMSLVFTANMSKLPTG